MIYKANKINVEIASKKILDGKIIIYPTDTLYGMGVDATNTESINKLNKIKKRNTPLSIIVGSFSMLEKFAKISSKNKLMIKNFLPGPFTFLLNIKKNNLSYKVSLKSNKIGIRIPQSDFILNVVNYINRPIITTSVNKQGMMPLNDLESIKSNFSNLDIFYGKVKQSSKGSTIIDYSSSTPFVIRTGDGNIVL